MSGRIGNHVYIAIGVMSAFFPGTEAADFLRAGQVNTSQLEANLLSELAKALRPGKGEGHRIPKLEGDLYSLFKSVPTESDGTLNHHVVRYVLHRFFASKHGWFIRGLEPDGDHRDDASDESHALTNVQEWVPSYLQKFLEQLNQGKGLSMREVAVFAATLEDLIHNEARERLRLAWEALGYPLDRHLHTSEIQKVAQTYMLIYNSNGDFTAESPAHVEQQLEAFAKSVKDWDKTVAWLKQVREKLYPVRGGKNSITFKQTEHLIDEIGEQYGAFNDADCANLKGTLLGMESKTRVGRIRLSEFYSKGLYTNWEFTEKKDYLRSLGALDESDPKQPYVIVANYVASRPNCLDSSKFYAVCCRNECEDILSMVENNVKGNQVAPAVLLKLVPRIRSSTVHAPRKLSDTLKDRLTQVADANGGKVPIHGRLFAQWMHHAYPRECPFPHEAGTANPETPDEWMRSAGQDTHRASEDEMRTHVSSATSHEEHAHGNDLPWSHAEELLHTRAKVLKRRPSTLRAILQKLAMFGVLGAMLVWLTLTFRSLSKGEKNSFGLKSHYA